MDIHRLQFYTHRLSQLYSHLPSNLYIRISISNSLSLCWYIRLYFTLECPTLFTLECPTLYYVRMSDSFLRWNVQLLSIMCKCPTPYLYVRISDYTFLSLIISYDTSRSTISYHLNVFNLTSACDNLSLSNPLTL